MSRYDDPKYFQRPPIKSYLVEAILCTIFCCVPFGIVAIIMAAQLDSKLKAGDYEGAQRMSDNARMWCWISFGCGLVTTIIICGLQLAAMSLDQSSTAY